MSFDLYFCRRDGPTPSLPELKQYFAALPLFKIDDTNDGGVQFWYQNEATGVYCSFACSPIDAEELEGCGSSGLSFNLNFNRPSFFAYETMPLVEAFCKHFDLVVEDSQEETVQPAQAERLIESWRAHNTWATGALAKSAKEEDMELHYLPEQRATEWWRYMSVKQGIEDSLTDDIFVPSLMIVKGSAPQPFTMMVWPDGIAQFFPPCDYIWVHREKKQIFRTKEETGLVAYQSVMDTINPLLDDYDFGNLQIKYLSPDKTSRVAPLIQSLRLEPVELSQHTRLAADGFHDVSLSGEAP
jgi:hypothetical protein